MKTLIVVHVFTEAEVPAVQAFSALFGDMLRIVTPMPLNFGTVWKVPDANKGMVEWTKRFLWREPYDVLVKIDPDTVIKGTLPPMPPNCDVAGDFRKSRVGWVWFGACQYYTRVAALKLRADPLYTGACIWQDVSLAAAVVRLGLQAFNMPEIDGWGEDPSAVVTHKPKTVIPRLPPGPVTFA